MPRLPATSLLNRRDDAPPAADADDDAPSRPAREMPRGRPPVSLQHTTMAQFGSSIGAFRQRFDEAQRRGLIDTLSMRRDGLIHGLLRRRQLAVVSLPWHVEPDDAHDPVQKAAAEKYTKILEATPSFGDLRLAIEERIFFGKAGAWTAWDYVEVNGQRVRAVVRHGPVNGDSIGYLYGGVPKIQVGATWNEPGAHVASDDRGRALILDDPYYRDRFIIGNFEPTAPDWQGESDMALAQHGLGLRSRLYWPWWYRNEVLHWHMTALERIGSNGMMYGFYDLGNEAAEEAMATAMKQIMLFNFALFPKEKGADPSSVFQHIDPATVAYETQFNLVDYLNGQIKQIVLGDDGSATVGAGSSAADLRTTTMERINLTDAAAHGDILTRDLLGPMIRLNDGSLPFKLVIKCQPNIENVGEKMAALRMAYDLKVPLDREDVYRLIGVAPPRDGANVVVAPDDGGVAPGSGVPHPRGDEDGADPNRSPARGIPPGINANLSRAARSGVQGQSAHVGDAPIRPMANGNGNGNGKGDGSGRGKRDRATLLAAIRERLAMNGVG